VDATPTTQRGYKYRLYPTPEQDTLLREWQETHRRLWNTLLGPYVDAIRAAVPPRKSWDTCVAEARAAGVADTEIEAAARELLKVDGGRFKNDVRALFKSNNWTTAVRREAERTVLRGLRKTNPFFQKIAYHFLDDVVLTHVKAWQGYFAGLTKMPCFKQRGECPSIRSALAATFKVLPTLKASSRDALVGLSMFAVGDEPSPMRFRKHRELPSTPSRIAISRRGTRWYVAFGVVVPALEAPTTQATVGIDRGVVHLLADSTGRTVPGLKPTSQEENRRCWIERRIAKKTVGSKRWAKWQAKLHRLTMRETDRRSDQLHKESAYYARSFAAVVIENLDVPTMTRSAKGTQAEPGSGVRQKAGLNRAILRQAWGALEFQLRYKLGARNGRLLTVPAQYTSQTCSKCGHVASANRPDQATFTCVHCGHSANADVNAAQVILARGLQPVVAPAPTKPRKTLTTVTGRKRAPRTKSSEVDSPSNAAVGETVKLPVEAGGASPSDETGSTTSVPTAYRTLKSRRKLATPASVTVAAPVLESSGGNLKCSVPLRGPPDT